MSLRWSILVLPILIAVAVVVYWGSPGNARLPEDDLVVWSNPAVTGPSLGPALLGQYYDSSREGRRDAVRPIATIATRIGYGLFHQDRAGFVWVRIFLLGVVGWLLFLVLYRQAGSPVAGLVGALLWAVHPITSNGVLTLAGGSILLALGFVWLGALLAARAVRVSWEGRSAAGSFATALVLWLFAAWSHEAAMAAFPAVAVWILGGGHGATRPGSARGIAKAHAGDDARLNATGGAGAVGRRGLGATLSPAWLLVAGMAGVVAVAVLFRVVAGALIGQGPAGAAVLPATGLGLGDRILLGLAAVPTALRLVFFPAQLGYVHDSLLHASNPGFRALIGAAVLLLLFGVGAAGVARGWRVAPWAALAFFGLMGAVNLPFSTGEFLSDRVLVLALPGFTGGLAVLAVAAWLRWRPVGSRREDRAGSTSRLRAFEAGTLIAGLVLAALLGARTAARADDHRSWETLVRAQLQTHPDSGRAHFDQGNLYLSRRQWSAATAEYEEALRLRPDMWMAWVNLGASYFGQNEPGLAARAYERALEGVQGNEAYAVVEARAQYNRALILMQQNRNLEATLALQRMLETFPDHMPSHANLGFIYMNAPAYYDQAEYHLRRALELETDRERARVLENRLAELERKRGDVTEDGAAPFQLEVPAP